MVSCLKNLQRFQLAKAGIKKASMDFPIRAILVLILLSGFFNLLSFNAGLDLEGKNIKLLIFVSTLILPNLFQAFKHKS
jgi:hypothetical protein